MSMKYLKLKERALKKKKKKKVQNRKRRRISEILALTDHDIEAVRSSKYLGTVNNNNNDETEEIKARITAANHSLFPSAHYM
jgi:predicted RNase H-like nuclease